MSAPSNNERSINYYEKFLMEREEILRHKWIESQKAHEDIGFERALTNWVIKHREKWRESTKQKKSA
jgi:RimJ/RimL family protein N-acetyltransferase